MKKTYLLLLVLFTSGFVYCQVGINTQDPKAIFHVDALGNNSTNPTVVQQLDDFVITNTGQVGIGTINPSPFSAIEIENNKPIRLPQLDATDIAELLTGNENNSNKNGLLVYNTTFDCLHYWQNDRDYDLCSD